MEIELKNSRFKLSEKIHFLHKFWAGTWHGKDVVSDPIEINDHLFKF